MLICQLYSFFSEISVHVFCPFIAGLFVLYCLVSKVYIFEILTLCQTGGSPMLAIHFLHRGFHTAGFFKILLRSTLLIFPFMDHSCFGDMSKKFLPSLESEDFLLISNFLLRKFF